MESMDALAQQQHSKNVFEFCQMRCFSNFIESKAKPMWQQFSKIGWMLSDEGPIIQLWKGKENRDPSS